PNRVASFRRRAAPVRSRRAKPHLSRTTATRRATRVRKSASLCAKIRPDRRPAPRPEPTRA
uniref:Uncharacterized protein n=1 Tax=Cucumis melo TaxID=3656 RepID=A0A9I9CDE1_CUCME